MVTKESKGVHLLECFGDDVCAGFSGRSFDSTRREEFLQLLGLAPEKLTLVKQVHSANICLVSKDYSPERTTAADGLITATPGAVLGILTADCVPVFFYDPDKKVAGLAHAGWRGIHHGIVRKMVQAFKQNFMSEAEDIEVAVGPAMRKCCYEVGDEFSEIFPGFYSETKASKQSHKGHMDLGAAIFHDLKLEGITPSQVYDTGACTSCDNDEFFSYRVDAGTPERILSVISLK